MTPLAAARAVRGTRPRGPHLSGLPRRLRRQHGRQPRPEDAARADQRLQLQHARRMPAHHRGTPPSSSSSATYPAAGRSSGRCCGSPTASSAAPSIPRARRSSFPVAGATRCSCSLAAGMAIGAAPARPFRWAMPRAWGRHLRLGRLQPQPQCRHRRHRRAPPHPPARPTTRTCCPVRSTWPSRTGPSARRPARVVQRVAQSPFKDSTLGDLARGRRTGRAGPCRRAPLDRDLRRTLRQAGLGGLRALHYGQRDPYHRGHTGPRPPQPEHGHAAPDPRPEGVVVRGDHPGTLARHVAAARPAPHGRCGRRGPGPVRGAPRRYLVGRADRSPRLRGDRRHGQQPDHLARDHG